MVRSMKRPAASKQVLASVAPEPDSSTKRARGHDDSVAAAQPEKPALSRPDVSTSNSLCPHVQKTLTEELEDLMTTEEMVDTCGTKKASVLGCVSELCCPILFWLPLFDQGCSCHSMVQTCREVR